MVSSTFLRRFVVLALFAVSLPVLAAEEVYRFSPVNQWDIPKTAAYWNPIIKYVSEQSGVKLELKIGRTSADTTAYVLAQEVEFVFSNHLFSPARAKLGWRVFGRRVAPPLRGQIAVLEDSPIKKLEDLHQHEVVFAGPEAFVGYRVPAAHLIQRGISINPIFAGNQNAAFSQLLAGRARAVGSNSALITGFEESEGKKLRVLWTSEPYLDLALMSSSKVPPKVLKAVANAFFKMHQTPAGREVLKNASDHVGLDLNSHFLSASDADYAAYRRFYETAPLSVQ